MADRENFGAAASVHLRNFTETSRAFSAAGKDAQKLFRGVFREVAQPLRHDVEEHARDEISHIGAKWWKARIGITRSLVYVAPQQRGRNSRRNIKLRRPNLKELLLEKAYDPGLEENEPFIEARTLVALDHLADRWEAF